MLSTLVNNSSVAPLNKPSSKEMSWWVGVTNDRRRMVFETTNDPTPTTHSQFKYCIGPHQTKAGAEYMAGPGFADTTCLTPLDAERKAARIRQQ